MNRSKAKGTAWETRLTRWLCENGFPDVERRALQGTLDKGDIAGIAGVVLELKNCRTIDLAGWIDEAVKEKANAKAKIGAVIFPRRNYGTDRAYVVMEMQQFAQMLLLLQSWLKSTST